jgi:hypothetical protein
VVGAVGGAVIGTAINYYDRDAAKTQALADSLGVEIASENSHKGFETQRAQANESKSFYQKLEDESLSAADAQAALSERIAKFGDEAQALKMKLMGSDLQRDTTGFAETMREYANALKQVDQATSAQRALGKDSASEGANGTGRIETLSDALTRIGGGVAGSGGMSDLAGIQREGIGIARDQLGVLREIKSEGLGTWA